MKDENKDLRKKIKKLFSRQAAKKTIVICSTDIDKPALIMQSDLLLRHEEYLKIANELEITTGCNVAILPPTLRIKAIISGEDQKGAKA